MCITVELFAAFCYDKGTVKEAGQQYILEKEEMGYDLSGGHR